MTMTIKKPVKKSKPKQAAKKKASPPSLKLRRGKEKLIGRIAHYYDKIKVAAITLKDTLSQGDTIRIEGGGKFFSQEVDSMQIEHEQVKKAKKGEDVGFKVKQKVREGYRVFKV
jgi:putative protease